MKIVILGLILVMMIFGLIYWYQKQEQLKVQQKKKRLEQRARWDHCLSQEAAQIPDNIIATKPEPVLEDDILSFSSILNHAESPKLEVDLMSEQDFQTMIQTQINDQNFQEVVENEERKLEMEQKKQQYVWDFDFTNKNPNQERQLIISLSLVAKPNKVFKGEKLLQYFEEHQLYYGDKQLFHYHLNNNQDHPILFSVANLLEPGNFDIDEMMDGFTTQGITLFMRLPNIENGLVIFERMLSTTRQLATLLSATILDQHHSTVGNQTIAYFREQVIYFDLESKRHHKQVAA